jgi:hypothetical protein
MPRSVAEQPASGSARRRAIRICHHATGNKVIDQRNGARRKMFGHRSAGKHIVMYLERSQDPPMILDRLARPARNRRKDRLGSVAGNLQHQLGKLWRVRRDIDGAVEFVVQPNGPLVVIAGIGLLQLGLNLLDLVQLIVGDVDRGPRGQFPTDMSLHIRDVSDVSPGHRQHHETAAGLLGDQAF